MATIIIEDGSKVTGANSYVTEAELATYASDRGITLSGTSSELLIKAMDYIEGLDYKGIKVFEDQPLQWPRAYVYVDTYPVEVDEIPKELKQGQMATAVAIDQGNSPLALADRKTKREKVDVLEVEYTDGSFINPVDPKIHNALRKLLDANGSGGLSFRVTRG